MSFILKMAWRDSRASRRRLALFALSVVLGIGALVAIGSFGANLTQAVDRQTKGLMGADLVVVGRAAPSPALQALVDQTAVAKAHEISFTSMLVAPSTQAAPRLVQVRALEGAFPFYGEFLTAPIDAVAAFRSAQNGQGNVRVILLEEALFQQFEVKVGDQVKLGEASFTIIGALRKLPGEGSAFSATFAARVLIPRSALESTGLLGKPTLVRYRTFLQLPATTKVGELVNQMRTQFSGERLSFETVEQRKRELGQALQNVQGFLSLVGFVALFLGAIGVASAIAVYVGQKVTTIAVLRCLGASARQGFAVYLVQGFALGLFGAVLGALLGIAVQLALPRLVAGMLPFDVEFAVSWPAVLRGGIAGLAICLLFTTWPLLAIRRVSPLVALRSAYAEDTGTRTDPWRWVLGGLIVVAVTGFAIWQTGSLKLGLGFSGMLAFGLGVLAGVARLVAWSARKLSASGKRRAITAPLPYVVRQGIANLHRPQNRTVLLLFALGLGTFLMLTLYLTRTTLLRQIEFTGGAGRPNLLFFDIQEDQLAPLKKLAAEQGAEVQVSAPVVTMRITAVNGRKVEELLGGNARRSDRGEEADEPKAETKAEPKGGRARRAGPAIAAWTLRREYRSTYRAELSRTERLLQGTFVGHVDPGTEVVPISLEESLAKDMNVKLGDEIDWDLQGVPLRSKLASLRAVEWRRLEPNFFVVFPEGVLETAPQFHIVAMRAETADISGRVQRTVIAAFPTVTAIDLALVMQTLDSVFTKVAFVIQFMALFTVATGVIVLVGAVLTGRYQRIRETVLLRTVGATRRQLTQIMLVEYAVLGFLAAVTGGSLAVIADVLLAYFVFKAPVAVPPLDLSVSVLLAMGLTLLTGFLANRGITNHPPLEVLRQET